MTPPTVREIRLPEMCLVVLIGITGSGKSTFARTHFAATQVLSSDAFRAMVADDENDQSASADAFAVLHHVAGLRLRAGRLTVVDATNVQPHARAALVRIAREHDVLPVAIVLDVSVEECWRRTQERPDRTFGRDVVARQHRDLRRSLGNLAKEGFRAVHTLHGPEEIANVRIAYDRLYNDRRDLTGPFDIIGDVHGCRAELELLLERLGYTIDRDELGRAVDAVHPEGRTVVFLGDLVDRGPDTPGVLRLVMGMVGAGHALCVMGNHEDKLVRALSGRRVKVAHGLAESLAQLEAAGSEFTRQAQQFLSGLVAHYVLDGGRLVVAHAGLKEAYHGRASGRVRAFALYGETTGETDEYGLPVRYPWAIDYRGQATVVYGHTPVPRPEWINNTICIDTGVVFGGSLTALRWPSRELVSVPAERVWYDPVRPLGEGAAPTPSQPASGRAEGADHADHPRPGSVAAPSTVEPEPAAAPGSARAAAAGLLRIEDVTGRRWIDTGYGRVLVPAENAAAALEVMGRFAIDPADLIWLPPTMAPCSTSTMEGYLEYPTEAFADYRRAGVRRVVCEAKHMGSRMVALVRRDVGRGVGSAGPGAASGGACWTRTGRPFFNDPALTAAVLSRLRSALASAGVFDELAADWVLLDTELLPWSAKALDLIREQYASVAAAARAALPVALRVLDAAVARGLDVGPLRDRTAARLARADAFAEAYRRYCWPTEGLDGIRVAPFAVLASGGAGGPGTARHYAHRDRGWHFGVVDRLVDAEPAFLARTDRRIVDLADETQVAEATRWWLALTEGPGGDSEERTERAALPTVLSGGGEGMVVKPYAGVTGAALVQPGIKCRGREYLRIIYGPDYTEPEQLARLRGRTLHRKRALALREHALGLAALDRLVAGEPLWRVHEAVFAILACESEPVDPRL
jgi:Predicted kinase